MRKVPVLFGFLMNTVFCHPQNRYDIVISEIMADPSPTVGLPNHEWIELKNISSLAVNLQNWRIGDASSQSGLLPSYLLLPDSFVIVCASGSLANLSPFGRAIPVSSFPSLDNDGDQLYLRSSSGKVIHAVNYESSWYRNALKKEGGWTLEMIDTHNPCSGESNWKASMNNLGGSPGQINSVDAINRDVDPPELKRSYTLDDRTIILVFNEPLDSGYSANPSFFTIDGGISFLAVSVLSPVFDRIQLKTSSPMQPRTIYNVSVSQVKDCQGNSIAGSHVKTGLSSTASAGEWIINEVLFNPRPNAYDYVEFLNKSDKIIDAAALFIANRNSNGVVSSVTRLSETPFLIFPGDHIVVTEDIQSLTLQYLVKFPDNVLHISMPSFANDTGTVIALDAQGNIIDELNYTEEWHFKLLDNNEGVSLERINALAPTQNTGNWHSAASTAGYGTPTYINSQQQDGNMSSSQLEIDPLIFSPDNDGRDDFCMIRYQVNEPGYMGNIIIYDAAGRPVRLLARNSTMGIKGSWNWDGLSDRGYALTAGTYIIFAEFFNLQGKKLRFKKAVVLARKLN